MFYHSFGSKECFKFMLPIESRVDSEAFILAEEEPQTLPPNVLELWSIKSDCLKTFCPIRCQQKFVSIAEKAALALICSFVVVVVVVVGCCSALVLNSSCLSNCINFNSTVCCTRSSHIRAQIKATSTFLLQMSLLQLLMVSQEQLVTTLTNCTL